MPLSPRARFARPTAATGVLAAAAFALVLGVAGCTAVGPQAGASTSATAAAPATTSAPAASGQTKAVACQILGSSLQDLSTSLQSAYSKYATDPDAAVADLQKVSDQFQTSVATVTAPDAKALAQKTESDLQTLITATKDAVNHPVTGIAKVEKLVPTIKTDVTKIATYCG